MIPTKDLYDNLKQAVLQTQEDVEKVGRNKAAGVRVRKAMQEIRAIAAAIRKSVLEQGKEGGSDAGE
jgi:hypothetical protein